MGKMRRTQLWISLVTSIVLLITGATGLYLGISASTAHRLPFTPGQGMNFNGGGNGASNGGWYARGNNQGNASGDSSSGQANNSNPQNRARMGGNFTGQFQFPGLRRENGVLQFLSGNYNGMDVRAILDTISGLILLLAIASGFTTVRLMKVEKDL